MPRPDLVAAIQAVSSCWHAAIGAWLDTAGYTTVAITTRAKISISKDIGLLNNAPNPPSFSFCSSIVTLLEIVAFMPLGDREYKK